MERITVGAVLAMLAAAPGFAEEGPAFWAVTGLAAGQRLDLRAEASSEARALGTVATGEVLRNKGCDVTAGSRWCLVDTPFGPGWVEGRFLRETAPPGLDDSLPEPPLLTTPPGLPAGNGTPFTAFGTLGCTTRGGEPSGTCTFGVIRTASGRASLWIALPAGGQRLIRFDAGKPVVADGAGRLDVTLEGDLFRLRIGPERFDVPRAAIDGE